MIDLELSRARCCSREVVGLPVVDISSGIELGVVKECAFDMAETRLIGMRIGERGPGKAEFALRFCDVKSLGQDLVTVCGLDALVPVEEADFLQDDGSLLNVSVVGKRIVSDMGRDIGIIKDVAVDAETGDIVGFEVSESIIQDILSGRNLIPRGSLLTVGEDVAIVPDTVGRG